jgi:hypothetical protein
MTRLNVHFNPYQRSAYERQMRRLQRPVLTTVTTPSQQSAPADVDEDEPGPPPAA